MFLTNNSKTINNLMIYSKGEYIPKIITKSLKNIIGVNTYWWAIKELQDKWNNILKNTVTRDKIRYTMKPFGIIKKHVYLRIEINGKIIAYDSKGVTCF